MAMVIHITVMVTHTTVMAIPATAIHTMAMVIPTLITHHMADVRDPAISPQDTMTIWGPQAPEEEQTEQEEYIQPLEEEPLREHSLQL